MYNTIRIAQTKKKNTFVKRLNLVKAPNDPKDYKVVVDRFTAVSLVDLSNTCSPIKNQGDIGACTSFATIENMEYIERRSNVRLDILSEKFTYYVTRVNVLNQDTSDSGALITDTIKAVVKYGACLNKTFPYDNDFTKAPPQYAYDEATKYQAITYAKFDDAYTVDISRLNTTINALKTNLALGYPIICGFVCYSNLFSSQNGIVPPQNGEIIGGHAILLVGYDDKNKLFKFKNSWGSSWGDNGYGYIPYDYYLKGDMFDLWSIYTQTANLQTIGITIVNPTINKQIILNEMNDILQSMVDNLQTFNMNKTKSDNYFKFQLNKYKNDKKMVGLISVLQQQYNSIILS